MHATFFLVGARVLENPGLARREVAQGDEIGVHARVTAAASSNAAV